MGLILRTAVLTDLGLRRGNNEDSAYAGRRLLVVADGMGGLPAGELASDLAVRALAPLDADDAGDSEEELVGALRAAFDAASGRIRDAAAHDEVNRCGMGTTVTAVLFAGDGTGRAAVMHVGDSRGYLFRDGVLTQITKDDTYVQALVDQGVIDADGARRHPQRSLVTQAMQGQPLDPFRTTLEPRAGDLFLLCSDGLSDVVTDDEIAQAVGSRAGLESCAWELVATAVRAGAPDNVTVVLGEVAEREAVS